MADFGQIEKQTAIMCNKCGAVNSAQNEVCSNCGTPLNHEISRSQKTDANPDPYKNVWKYGVAFVVIFLIFALILKYRGLLCACIVAAVALFIIGIVQIVHPSRSIIKRKINPQIIGEMCFTAAVIVFAAGIVTSFVKWVNTPTQPALSSTSTLFSGASTVSSSSSATQSSSSPASSASSAKPLSPPSVITGSNAADLKLSLEQWGLKDYKCTARTDGFEGYFYKCETSDPDTGAELTYFISTNEAFAVEGTTFSVSNMDMADSDSFLSVCQGYLGYCATMPYDVAQQAKAKSWVEENMASANTKGHVLSIVIGDAKFELFGISNTSRTLEISKAK